MAVTDLPASIASVPVPVVNAQVQVSYNVPNGHGGWTADTATQVTNSSGFCTFPDLVASRPAVPSP